MDAEIEKTMTCLQSRRINAIFAENSEAARTTIMDLVPSDSVVAIGDSAAVRQIGLAGVLEQKARKILNPYRVEGTRVEAEQSAQYHSQLVKEGTLCDAFISGTNAITQDGRIVNVDGFGNRVAGMFWGHPVSIILVGKNKIVRDLDEAFDRIRNVIAPNHVRIRTVELGGRKRNTPCVATGECSDCRSPDRICNVFTIIEGKPGHTNLNVVMVDEDLGLGWDPSWPQDRIAHIVENYKKFAWLPERVYR